MTGAQVRVAPRITKAAASVVLLINLRFLSSYSFISIFVDFFTDRKRLVPFSRTKTIYM